MSDIMTVNDDPVPEENGVAKLSELLFSDLYIRLDLEDEEDQTVVARYNPQLHPFADDGHVGDPKSRPRPGNYPVPDRFLPKIRELRDQLRGHEEHDFSIQFESMRLRAARQQMAFGEVWFALRYIRITIPELDILGIPKQQLATMLNWGQRNGLIIIGGETGAGKTTTAMSLLYQYLLEYGQSAYTVEEPVEYWLQGEIGAAGVCFQHEISDDSEWAEAIKTTKRFKPRYILVGEVRTAAAAVEILNLIGSGHLIITTTHAGSLEETLMNLLVLADAELGQHAFRRLASSLIGVIHQRMTPSGPRLQVLETDPRNTNDRVRNTIRSGDLFKLQELFEAIQSRPS